MISGLQPTDSLCKTEPVYQLGHVTFFLKNCDSQYKEELEKLLPHFVGDLAAEQIQEINTGCTREVSDLIRQLASLHHKQQCVWIEACCLISPAGHKVIIAGKSKSGKSTTAMALALGSQWRILAENFCIIDYEANRLLKFLSPASFGEKSLDILKRNGLAPAKTFTLEFRKNRVWAPLADLINDDVYKPDFDFAIWLERDEQSSSDFSSAEISSAEFARKLLAMSNLLKIKGSYDALTESLASTRCLNLKDGELEQRLEIITNALTEKAI